MEEIAKTALHSMLQMGVGIAVGTAADLIMPAPQPCSSPSRAIMCLLEIQGQFILNSLSIAFLAKALRRVEGAKIDPAQGTSLFLSLMIAQPNLNMKVAHLAQYAREKLGVVEAKVEKEIEGVFSKGTMVPQSYNKQHLGGRTAADTPPVAQRVLSMFQ